MKRRSPCTERITYRGILPRRWQSLLAMALLAMFVVASVPAARAESTTAPTTEPATVAAAAPAAPAAPATNDPTGGSSVYQATSVSVPNYNAPKDPKNPTPDELKQVPANLDAVAQQTGHVFYSINFVWTLVAGFLVMFMQAGFALVETGLGRAKNASHTMAMNFMVYGLGMLGFFVCGYAFMCGGANGSPIGGPGMLGGTPSLDQMWTLNLGGKTWAICGHEGFFLAGRAYDVGAIAWFLFMMVFMDTTATIPTGCMAERWKWSSFCLFSPFIGGFIYVIYGCWVWGGGWLAQLGLNAGLGHGAVDYAGSSVVHMQGGVLALILGAMIGPRIGKYDKNGKPRTIPAHHIPMVMLGTFILAFGWFGFNAGSSLAGSDLRIGVIAVNTMLASASGAITSMLYMMFIHPSKKPDPGMMCNGMLAGLVAITAPCAFVTPWVAFFLVGGIAGVLVVISAVTVEKMGVDDVVGAISVHGVCGLYGILCLGLFADGTYGDGYNGIHLMAHGASGFFGYKDIIWNPNGAATPPEGWTQIGVTGLFYGNSKQFFAECIAGVTCFVWNAVAGGVIFWIIGKILGGNRVSPEVELAGLDIPEMGAFGYPEFVGHTPVERITPADVAAAREGEPVLV